jgi:hypothetical protein
MVAIISQLIPILITAVGAWINIRAQNKELKRQWLLFVLEMQNQGHISMKLRDEYERQLQELNSNIIQFKK